MLATVVVASSGKPSRRLRRSSSTSTPFTLAFAAAASIDASSWS